MYVPSDIVANLIVTTAVLFGILGIGVGIFITAAAALFSERTK